MNNLVNVKQILNGYFYTFEYTATSALNSKLIKKIYDFDSMPIIFCIGPVENNLNCFMGLNFNHLSRMKKPFFDAMNERYKITENDIRHVISKKDILTIGKNVAEQGIRYYNRKNVRNPMRIINSAIPNYLNLDGKFILTTQEEEDSRFSVDTIDKGLT